MKQVRFSETGDAGVARMVAVARPDVCVESARVSFADIVRRRGDPHPVPTPLPEVPGSEVAGFVEAVGEDVKDLTAETLYSAAQTWTDIRNAISNEKVRPGLLRRPMVALTTTHSLPGSPEQASNDPFKTSARTQCAGSIQQTRSLR